MITEIKRQIDLKDVVRASGVELRRAGKRYVAPCPFHDETYPSFYVFKDQRFKCFGCGEHGDAIDFVKKLHGLTFKEALTHLGIKQGGLSPEMRRKIDRRKQKAALVRQFNLWCGQYAAHLGTMINRTERFMRTGIPPDDLDLYATLIEQLPLWEYHSDILINGSDREKFLIFKEAHGHGQLRFSKAT